jgi:hypothetical protein
MLFAADWDILRIGGVITEERIMRLLLPLLAVALSGCTASAAENARAMQRSESDEQKLAKALEGLTPQKPVSCIDDHRSGAVEAYGPTILYKVGRGLVYRSDTAGGCENLGRGDIFVTHTITGQLCRGDIAQTVDPTSRTQSGSCSLGTFTPYRKVKP